MSERILPPEPSSSPSIEVVDDLYPMTEPWASTVDFDEKVVIYDENDHCMLVLSASAGQIWDRCDGSRSLDQIVVELAELYRVDPMLVRDDVWSTVSKLTSLGLLGGRRARSQPENSG
jgi:hypothetical protein